MLLFVIFFSRAITKTDRNISYSSTVANVNLKCYDVRERLDYLAKHHPQKVPFVFNMSNGLELTYGEIREQSSTLAKNLMSLGLKKGERVAILLPNTHEIVISLFACSLAGLISVPLDADYGSDEIEYMLNKTEPSAAIVYDWPSYQGLIGDLFAEIDTCALNDFKSSKFASLRHFIRIDAATKDAEKSRQGAWSYDQLISKLIETNESHEFPYIDADDVFSIMFTVI